MFKTYSIRMAKKDNYRLMLPIIQRKLAILRKLAKQIKK
jgi:hypothetical protein